MKIDGRKIAETIVGELKTKVGELAKKSTLAIIQVGDNPESTSFIQQKKKIAQRIGIKVLHDKFPKKTTEQTIKSRVGEYNKNLNVQGIIVQLPLPPHLSTDTISHSINLQKDIDGFLPNSPYTPPVSCAVLTTLQFVKNRCRSAPDFYYFSVLENSASATKIQSPWRTENFKKWFKAKNIVVIGRGKTGGGPILKSLNALNIPNTLIHSQTPNPAKITQEADIIISCVGKPNIVKPDMIKKGVILIGVGIYQGKSGQLHGDYDEKDIKDKALFYTPTPGGIGPLTVACLMKNVLKATNPKL